MSPPPPRGWMRRLLDFVLRRQHPVVKVDETIVIVAHLNPTQGFERGGEFYIRCIPNGQPSQRYPTNIYAYRVRTGELSIFNDATIVNPVSLELHVT